MKKTIMTLVVGMALGSVAYAIVPKGLKNEVGPLYSHETLYQYKMSLGKTNQGQPLRTPQDLHEIRAVMHVPDYYGELVNITTVGEDSVLWYRDSGGSIRNSVVENSAKRLYVVAPEKIQKLEIDVVPSSNARR